jgi:hypothetical protein
MYNGSATLFANNVAVVWKSSGNRRAALRADRRFLAREYYWVLPVKPAQFYVLKDMLEEQRV